MVTVNLVYLVEKLSVGKQEKVILDPTRVGEDLHGRRP